MAKCKHQRICRWSSIESSMMMVLKIKSVKYIRLYNKSVKGVYIHREKIVWRMVWYIIAVTTCALSFSLIWSQWLMVMSLYFLDVWLTSGIHNYYCYYFLKLYSLLYPRVYYRHFINKEYEPIIQSLLMPQSLPKLLKHIYNILYNKIKVLGNFHNSFFVSTWKIITMQLVFMLSHQADV